MRGIFRKSVFALLLLAVLLLSYFVAFALISITPYGHYSARVYSSPETFRDYYGNSSTMGGEWLEQLLGVNPAPGATNVPRDTSLIIDAPRPVRVFNISLSPSLPIVKDNYKLSSGFSPPSSVQTVYPSGLLEPNTTYNVSAVVAGTPSWWIFTTSSEPSQLTFDTHPSPNDTWFALAAATLFISGIFLQVRKHPGILSNYIPRS